MRIKPSLICAVILATGLGCSGEGLVSPNWRVAPDVLTYTASTRVVPYPYLTDHPAAVEATIVIANNTSRSITFNYSRGICEGLQIRAFTSPDFSGTPAWTDSQAGLECAAVGYGPSALEPGRSVEVVAYNLVSSVLGSVRPAGTYYFQARVFVGGGYVRNSTVLLPAGSVQLNR